MAETETRPAPFLAENARERRCFYFPEFFLPPRTSLPRFFALHNEMGDGIMSTLAMSSAPEGGTQAALCSHKSSLGSAFRHRAKPVSEGERSEPEPPARQYPPARPRQSRPASIRRRGSAKAAPRLRCHIQCRKRPNVNLRPLRADLHLPFFTPQCPRAFCGFHSNTTLRRREYDQKRTAGALLQDAFQCQFL